VPITTDFVNSNVYQGEVYNIVIEFVCDLRQVVAMVVFLGPPVSSTSKTDRHEITEILLKVVLNTIKQTNKPSDPGSKINAKCSMSKYSNIQLHIR
jgi:hypothetical protein